MIWLVLGLVLWVGAHVFKRIAPGARAALGAPGKGVVALVIVVSLVLMIVGYRSAPVVPVYTPFAGAGHLNNLLMLVALWVYAAGMSKGVLWTKIRHPQLTGVAIWAVAHLLVNGDLASVLLFGTLLIWALGSIRVVSAAEGPWLPHAPGSIRRDLAMVAISLVVYAALAWVHIWTGHNPFGGTYG